MKNCFNQLAVILICASASVFTTAHGQGLSVTISPSADSVVTVDGAVGFSCSASGGCPPYTYSWSFENASGTPPTDNKDPGDVTFGSSAEGKKNKVDVIVTDITQATSSDQVNVIVPEITFDKVERADSIGDSGGKKIFAIGKGNGNVSVKLKKTPSDVSLPDGFVTWTGGAAGTDQLTRTLSQGTLQETGVAIEASAGSADIVKTKIYIFEPKPAEAVALEVNITVKRDDASATPFGKTDRAGALSPTNKYKIYYDQKNWQFIYEKVEYEIKWGVNSGGRADVPSGNANPFPLGAGMAAGSTEAQKKTQAKADLTPDATGMAPRAAYWSSSLTEKHELFHVSDWRDGYHKPKLTEAETNIEAIKVPVTINNLVPATVLTDKEDDLDKEVSDRTDEANDQYSPGKETRAYGDGKADYEELADSITP